MTSRLSCDPRGDADEVNASATPLTLKAAGPSEGDEPRQRADEDEQAGDENEQAGAGTPFHDHRLQAIRRRGRQGMKAPKKTFLTKPNPSGAEKR